MTAAVVILAGYLAALAVIARRSSQAEQARLSRMYDGRRVVVEQVAAARIDYFARTAPADEIRAAVRLHESAELDRAAARVIAEMEAAAVEESARRQARTDPEETR